MTLSLKEFGDGEFTMERGKEFHNGTMLIKKDDWWASVFTKGLKRVKG